MRGKENERGKKRPKLGINEKWQSERRDRVEERVRENKGY